MKFNLTADGDTAITWPGGQGQLCAQGTFGGGTLALQFSLDGGTTWTALEDDPASSLSAAGTFVFSSMRTDAVDYQLRLNLSGSTTPNINIKIGDYVARRRN